MSLPPSNTTETGPLPMDLSRATQPSSESHVTIPAISVGQNTILSHATVANFQTLPTYGIRVSHGSVTMPGPISQDLSGQMSSNLHVARSAVPLISTGIGSGQMVYPRMTHASFPQTIPISSAIIGQQITLQRLPNKVQHLPVGSVTQISGQQVIQHGSVSPGKAISPRPGMPVGSLQRPVISNFTTAQHFQKSSTPTLVSVSQGQQIGLRIPNVSGQQMAIQRTVSPLIAQQMSGVSQANFIQCLSNASVVSQQLAQSSPNAGSLQTSQPGAGSLRATSPIGTATIVGPTSHMGTATFVAAQPISIQPRPPVAYIASAPPTGMTLTVTSISPSQTALQTSSTSRQLAAPNQQLLWPGTAISQGQLIRTGIPVVLPSGTLTFAHRPQLIQNSTGPRLIQKPLVSLSTNCGGHVTMQVPQVITPVIKTVLQSQPAIMSSKDNEVIQSTSMSQPTPGVIYSAVLVSTSGVTTSSQPPIATLTTASPASQMMGPNSMQPKSQPTNLIEPGSGLKVLPPVSSGPPVTHLDAPVSLRDQPVLAPVEEGARETTSGATTENNITSTTTGVTAVANQNLNHPADPGVLALQGTTEVKDRTSPVAVTNNSQVTSPVALTNNSQASRLAVSHNQESPQSNLVRGTAKVSPDSAGSHGEPSSTCPVTSSDAHNPTASSPATSPQPVPGTDLSSSVSFLSLNGCQPGTANETEDAEKPPGAAEMSGHDCSGNTDGGILSEGLIDSNLLEWSDGVGKLPGTDMKFKINEFGDLELIEEAGSNVEVKSAKAGETKPGNHVVDGTTDQASRDRPSRDSSVKDPSELSDHEGDPICCCLYCGRYGYKSNFKTSGRYCSQGCAGKRKFQRKQVIMSRMMMGMKKKKKKMILSGEMKTLSGETKILSGDQQNGSGPVLEKKLLSFDWDSYLAETRAVAAPRRLFKEPFPASRNGFRLGMRLEGIDPKHQSLFCVLSVAEVQGYRLRLHFDGYSECYDFWVNADSPFIFPVGWAEKNGKVLQPPKNVLVAEFNWTNYLKQTRAVAAPKHLFLNQPSSIVPSAFRMGMKLEAVDKKNSNLVCVSTVADTLTERILIHFDGWEDTYDYWCDVISPSIHPVGWCQEHGHNLSPPPDYDDGGNFTWDTYLQDSHSTAVPARAFKTRGPMGFEKGMKVEVTDKRNPILIRVATIADVHEHRLLIHFDGWDSIYDYWIDDDSGDLHPANWCSKTFHPLQSPIDRKGLKYVSDTGGCPTVGCNGIGHIKGAKYTGHHSAFGCPYSEVNMSKDSALTDRLGSSRSEEGAGLPARYDGVADMRKCPTPGCDGLGHVTGKFTSHHCLSGCPLAEKNLAKIKLEAVPEPRPVGRPGRGRKRKMFSLSQPLTEKMIKTEVGDDIGEDRSVFHASIHESVFQSMAPTLSMTDQPLCWEQHAKLLPGVAEVSQTIVSNWSVDEVAEFVHKLTGNEEQAQKFREEQVDGDSFLLLQQNDLMNCLNIKLGPAIKIFNSILVFKAASESY